MMKKIRKKRKINPQKSSSEHLSLTTIRIVVISGTLLSMILLLNALQITRNFANSRTMVLGDNEESEEVKNAEEERKEAEKKAEEQQKENQKEQVEQQKESEKRFEEFNKENRSKNEELKPRPSTRVKTKTEAISTSSGKLQPNGERRKGETEIETADGQKIKTKIEDDGTTKVEVEDGNFKLKYRMENGQMRLAVENDDGDEIEVDQENLDELKDELENDLADDDVQIATTSGRSLSLTRKNVRAITNFPLSVNTVTNELVVMTPNGQKIVTILPDQAVRNLLSTGIISRVEPVVASDSASLSDSNKFDSSIEMEMKDDVLVYKIKGKRAHRLFGIIPVSTDVTAFTSVDTGSTVSVQQSALSSLIDFISL